MINLPIANHIAFRAIAFYQRDAGFIDNVFGERTYLWLQTTGRRRPFRQQPLVREGQFQRRHDLWRPRRAEDRSRRQLDRHSDVHVPEGQGPRRALRWMPTSATSKTVRFRPEVRGTTSGRRRSQIEGKIANFDMTYAGAYMDRPRLRDNDYTDYTDRLLYSYLDIRHHPLLHAPACSAIRLGRQRRQHHRSAPAHQRQRPFQEVEPGTPRRDSGGQTDPGAPRRILPGPEEPHPPGLFGRRPGDRFVGYWWAGTLWLTNQLRKDKDYAIFGEVNWDVIPHVTLTGGRATTNSIIRSSDSTALALTTRAVPPLGFNRCLTTSGKELRDPIWMTTPLMPGAWPTRLARTSAWS